MEVDQEMEDDQPILIDLESSPEKSIIIVSTESKNRTTKNGNGVNQEPLDLSSPIVVHKSPTDILKLKKFERIPPTIFKDNEDEQPSTELVDYYTNLKVDSVKPSSDDLIQDLLKSPVVPNPSITSPSTSSHGETNSHLSNAGSSSTTTSIMLEDFLNTIKDKLKPDEFDSMRNLLKNLVKRVDTPENEKSILEEMKLQKKKIVEKGKVWTSIRSLKKKLEVMEVENKSSMMMGAEQQKREDKIAKLEVYLGELNTKIKDLDEADDWDCENEFNSPYILKDRYVKRVCEVHKLICKYSNSSTLTGRAIEEKFKIKKKCQYPEINSAVESFIRKKGTLFLPDYVDIHSVVMRTIKKEKLIIFGHEIDTISFSLFQDAFNTIKNRRIEDSKMILIDDFDKIETPEANDPELKKLLEENDKKAKSEKEVIAEFVKKQQELNAEAIEVDIGDDSSCPSTDDEDEFDSKDEDSASDTSAKNKDSEKMDIDTNTTIDLDDSDDEDCEDLGEDEIEDLLNDDDDSLPEEYLLTDDE